MEPTVGVMKRDEDVYEAVRKALEELTGLGGVMLRVNLRTLERVAYFLRGLVID